MTANLRLGRARSHQDVYAGLLGLFLALSLLKWGNPVTLDIQVGWPTSSAEWKVASWPILSGYLAFGVVGIASFFFFRRDLGVPKSIQLFPLVWFGWQVIASAFSINPASSWAVLPHFGVCVALFFIGLHCFSALDRTMPLWLGLFGGFGVVLIVGWHQHLVGFAAMREFLYSLPNWQELPPEFLKKVSSNRIYSTLVYPNALATVVLLLTPLGFGLLWEFTQRTAKWIVGAVLLVLSGGCLYWSGSKSGWLIAVFQLVLMILLGAFSRKVRLLAAALVVLLGVGGFVMKHQAYIDQGASSLGARFEYWSAAWITITKSPIVGAGPGTFFDYYRQLKSPDAEMTRLAHNDYLQQASDSGVPGALAFLSFWVTGLSMLYRNRHLSPLRCGAFFGIFGAFLHGFLEFGLYIPAVSWVTWFLFGWALSCRNAVDKQPAHS